MSSGAYHGARWASEDPQHQPHPPWAKHHTLDWVGGFQAEVDFCTWLCLNPTPQCTFCTTRCTMRSRTWWSPAPCRCCNPCVCCPSSENTPSRSARIGLELASGMRGESSEQQFCHTTTTTTTTATTTYTYVLHYLLYPFNSWNSLRTNRPTDRPTDDRHC